MIASQELGIPYREINDTPVEDINRALAKHNVEKAAEMYWESKKFS